MATVNAVATEIKEFASYVRARRPTERIQEGVVNSITKKIAALGKFETADATMLTLAIENTAMTEELRIKLNDACDSRLSVHLANETITKVNPSGAPPRDQCIRFMNNYPKQSDWTKLNDIRSSSATRDTVLAELMTSLGVRRASEEGLVKWAMVILVHIEQQLTGVWPTYWQIYERVPPPLPTHPLQTYFYYHRPLTH